MSTNLQADQNKESGKSLKKLSKLTVGTYYVRNGRLYYIVDINWKLCKFKVENCETLITETMSSEQLQSIAKEVRIIHVGDSTSTA